MSETLKNPVRLSAIVPARNEEAVIRECVESLARQKDIGEILVVDDQSTDRTASFVWEMMERIPHLRLLAAKGPAKGWVGKNNAVWLGAREAKGEWLLFTDADSIHEGDSAERALAIAREQTAMMVSFSPEQILKTWYEKSLIPYVYCRLASHFSFDEVNDPAKSAAAANGQFLQIRRDVYDAVGGHASVAGEVLEDVALARKVKGAGHRIWFGSGKGIVRVRMYRTFRAMWQGWKKNLYPLMGGKRATIGKEIARALAPLLAIYIATVSTWAFADSVLEALGVIVVGTVVLSVAYDGELTRNGFPGRLVLYGIPGRVLFAGVLLASYRSYRRGKLEWKGREYPVGTPGASNEVAK